jgi:hypothetical protein
MGLVVILLTNAELQVQIIIINKNACNYPMFWMGILRYTRELFVIILLNGI